MKKNTINYTTGILFFLIILSSCQQRKSEFLLPELSRAEAIMYEYPDSALLILEQMQPPSPSDELQYATWCLLLTQARYKNYITQNLDSLINIAHDYFTKQEDAQKKALALYLKGGLYLEWREADKALSYMLDAAKEVEKTDDYQLGHLIHLEIGSIYVYRVLYPYAEKAFQKSLEFAKASENKVYIASSLLHIARIHALTKSYETSIPHYKEAVEAAKLSQRANTISSALSEIAAMYCECGDYESALHCVYEALQIRIENNLSTEQIKLNIGEIYYSIGKKDSVYIYLSQAIDTDNIYTKRSAYRVLYNLAKEEKNYEEAMEYGDLYQLYADSIQKLDRSSALIEIQEKYNQEKILNEKNLLQIEKERTILHALIFSFSLLFIIALLIFIYQRKLLEKERTIQKQEERIRTYSFKIHENEFLINRNESHLQELTQEMEQNPDIQEFFKEQQRAIQEIRNQNNLLHQENQQLQANLSLYSSSLQEKSKELKALKILSEKNTYLQEREKFLCHQLVKRTQILNELKTSPKYLDVIKWEEVKEAIDWLYENFTKRISKDIDTITENDIQICCLIKLRLGIPEMAEILGISPSSVSKRKLRLKDRIMQKIGYAFDKEQTLDVWIWEF